jgi:hypothetical protein
MNSTKDSIDNMMHGGLSICSTLESLVAELDELRRLDQADG